MAVNNHTAKSGEEWTNKEVFALDTANMAATWPHGRVACNG